MKLVRMTQVINWPSNTSRISRFIRWLSVMADRYVQSLNIVCSSDGHMSEMLVALFPARPVL